MPKWLAVIGIVIAWLNGALFGGAMWGAGPFWRGVRSVFTFGRSVHDR